jgi:hypothetical protein
MVESVWGALESAGDEGEPDGRLPDSGVDAGAPRARGGVGDPGGIGDAGGMGGAVETGAALNDAEAAARLVEVAVDAPGASRTYTYWLPARLAGVEAGEAVLVEFGRGRQALGVVLGAAAGDPVGQTKPILARVRADGPLLPALSLAFARWISQEYLAPPAAVLRSMLPPGMLERLDLLAERVPPPASGVEGETFAAA